MEPWTPENEDLIREVQKRSALYDHSVSLSALGREKLWLEVCQSLCPEEFHEISDDQKEIRVREIRKKWRNLRDCFTKDINQRSRRYQGKRKRRKYLYFDDLLFLAPFVTPGEKTPTTTNNSNSTANTNFQNQTNNSEEDVSNDNSCDVADEDSAQAYEMVSFSGTDNGDSATRRPTTSATAAAGGGGIDPTAFLQLTNGVEEDIDEDKAFLLSLVPAFRRLTQSQRLAAKIEMLKVVQRISFPEK